jgi:hypothetical protein
MASTCSPCWPSYFGPPLGELGAWPALPTRPAPDWGLQSPGRGSYPRVPGRRLPARQTADRRPAPSLPAGDASPSWLGQLTGLVKWS